MIRTKPHEKDWGRFMLKGWVTDNRIKIMRHLGSIYLPPEIKTHLKRIDNDLKKLEEDLELMKLEDWI